MTDGLLALPPSQERNDRSLIASSSAGEFRERELGVGKPLARFRYMYPSGFFQVEHQNHYQVQHHHYQEKEHHYQEIHQHQV